MSPYRAVEPALPARLITANEHTGSLVDLAVLAVATAAVCAIAMGELMGAAFFGFLTLLLGAMRVLYLFANAGLHRIDADARGVRVRCSKAALMQTMAVLAPRAVDLFIPWDECLSVEARTHPFGDDAAFALVITTPTDVIAVRAAAFRADVRQIATQLHAAREELAGP